MQVTGIGKIGDIFANRSLTVSHPTKSNDDGVERLLSCMEQDFTGLCFLNLVDFDMLYGHRNDVRGYAEALNRFDAQLPSILARLQKDDLLLLTADHGCDPSTPSTDHSREYVPLLLLGTASATAPRSGFSRASTASPRPCAPRWAFRPSAPERICCRYVRSADRKGGGGGGERLRALLAFFRRRRAASVRTGRCSAAATSKTPRIPQRSAPNAARSARPLRPGRRRFTALAVYTPDDCASFYPCAVCLQALSEFCGPDLEILCTAGGRTIRRTLGELLPFGFRLGGEAQCI